MPPDDSSPAHAFRAHPGAGVPSAMARHPPKTLPSQAPTAIALPLILPASESASIVRIARLLRDGGIAAIPTDTVYGLAASVFRPSAIERIFAVKRRAPDMAVPVLLASAVDLPILVKSIPAAGWKLINQFWPGPLTLVLSARETVPRSITGGGQTVAVRVPADRVTLQLLQTLGEPVIGTSANRHGEPPAVGPAEVIAQLGHEVDAVLSDNSPSDWGGIHGCRTVGERLHHPPIRSDWSRGDPTSGRLDPEEWSLRPAGSPGRPHTSSGWTVEGRSDRWTGTAPASID